MGSTLLGLGHPPPQYLSIHQVFMGREPKTPATFVFLSLSWHHLYVHWIPWVAISSWPPGKPYFKLLFLLPSGLWCHQAQKELHLAVGPWRLIFTILITELIKKTQSLLPCFKNGEFELVAELLWWLSDVSVNSAHLKLGPSGYLKNT